MFRFDRTHHRHIGVAAMLALLPCFACVDGTGPDDDAILFVTQTVDPGASLQALFDGEIIIDSAGCVRQRGTEGAMVVWPKGFRLDDGVTVRDGRGREIGRIGERFRLGGGFVQSIHSGFSVSADRKHIESRCPGSYWITGEVLVAR